MGNCQLTGPTASAWPAVLRPLRPLSLPLACEHSGQLSSSVRRQPLSASIFASVKQANGLDPPHLSAPAAAHGWVGGRFSLHSWSVWLFFQSYVWQADKTHSSRL